MTRAAVLGTGSWGTTFAMVLADAGAEVSLLARRASLPRQAKAEQPINSAKASQDGSSGQKTGPADVSHLTIFPLAFVGTAHATGHLLGLGIVGVYAWRTYENTKQRPNAVHRQSHVFEGSHAHQS